MRSWKPRTSSPKGLSGEDVIVLKCTKPRNRGVHCFVEGLGPFKGGRKAQWFFEQVNSDGESVIFRNRVLVEVETSDSEMDLTATTFNYVVLMRNIEFQLNQFKKKRLLVVFPHPDDESFNTAGLIQRVKKMGWRVRIVILTRGEKGKNHLGKGKLALIREKELRRVGEILGIDELMIWREVDGGLKKGRRWREKIKSEIEKYDPGLVVSYDFSGMSGHPDHIALSVELFEILKKKKRVVLWWAVWPGLLRRFMVHSEVREMMQRHAFRLDLTKEEHEKKCGTIKAHQSQLPNWKWWQKLLLKYFICAHEYFALADFGRKYCFKFVDFRI